jgi:CheY-like chemotaxis protein
MKKVLIVDDEASFLLSLKDVLKVHRDKFEIITAENGSVAVELLRDIRFDLLVTDLRMPEMNGFELLAWVSRHMPQLPVIAMSAFGTPEIEARLRKMDTIQFIEKPVDLPVLEKAIFNGLKAGGKSFIRGITLATFLQLINVEKKNCTLKIASSPSPAYLFVADGELIDAEYANMKGLEAALEVVSWCDAEIEMDGICRRQNDVVNMPLSHLLIEAFRIKDEAAEELKRDGAKVPDDNDNAEAKAVAENSDSPQQQSVTSPIGEKAGSSTPLINELKELPGVVGICLYDLNSGIKTSSLPSSFREDRLELIGSHLAKIYATGATTFDNFSDLSLHFDESVIVVRTVTADTLCFVVCDPAYNLNVLLNLMQKEIGDHSGREG